MAFFQVTRHRLATSAVALMIAVAPLAVGAQELPTYAQPSTVISTDETIHGRIRSVDGAFNISVDDDRGFVDNVLLHQGTIINPTGLTLSPGMSVTIMGANDGSTFGANEIDTPYSYEGPLPTPVYYGPGYWCPGFAYGYGPSFSLAIIIGGGGYHGWSYEHRPFNGRPWNGHGYFGAAVGLNSGERGRLEERHPFDNGDSVRRPSGDRFAGRPAAAHVPSAFAGRGFAAEPRGYGERMTRTAPDGNRNSYSQESEARSAGVRTQRSFGGNENARGSVERGGGQRSAPSHGESHGGGRPH